MREGKKWLTVVATDPPDVLNENTSLDFAQRTKGVRLQVQKVGPGNLNVVFDLFGWIPDSTGKFDQIEGAWAKFQRITLVDEFPTMILPLTGDYNYIADFSHITFKKISGDDIRIRLGFSEAFEE